MGREAKGNISDVWKFNFATSFSFSLIEQLVGNNIWNSTVIGSVTLGLIESYMNNKTLEIFTSNRYVFIKHADDNTTLPFLDLQTGTVRDCFSYYGLLGTMPCYHDKITDNAWKYGNNLLDETSVSYLQLDSIADYSTSVALIGGVFASDSLLVAGETISAATLTTVGSILFVIALPIVFELSRPKLAEMLNNMGYHEMAQYYHTNNTLDMVFDALLYFIYGDASNIPFEQRCFLFMMLTSSFLIHPEYISFSLSNPNSDLNKLIDFITSFSKKQYDYIIQPDINDVKYTIKNAPAPDDPDLPLGDFVDKLKESFIDLKRCIKNGDINGFFHNSLVIAFGILCIESLILNSLGKEILNAFKKSFESMNNDSLP